MRIDTKTQIEWIIEHYELTEAVDVKVFLRFLEYPNYFITPKIIEGVQDILYHHLTAPLEVLHQINSYVINNQK